MPFSSMDSALEDLSVSKGKESRSSATIWWAILISLRKIIPHIAKKLPGDEVYIKQMAIYN